MAKKADFTSVNLAISGWTRLQSDTKPPNADSITTVGWP